ncbi:MAG TPA: hypothetical protein DD856_13060 [Sulfobacillus sp.]|nr:hypothetical protein [Sulfobacillus sp.]
MKTVHNREIFPLERMSRQLRYGKSLSLGFPGLENAPEIPSRSVRHRLRGKPFAPSPNWEKLFF